jgi:pimeloyl-ACP methyl ester carboxylesterase/DNA-binding CsgD family transcriptional regulator
MNAPPVQYVRTSDGYDIAYGVTGSGTALLHLPFLFQHFSLFWSTVRGPALSALAERFRLYVYDGRGQGSSTRGLNESLTLDDLARDLDSVVSRVNEPKFVLYGPAAFGLVALRYAVRRPERVTAIVLWNYIDTSLAAYARGYRELAAADWDTYLQNQARASWYDYDSSLMMRLLPETMTQDDHLVLARTLRSGSAEDVAEKVGVPTLILATLTGQRAGMSEESGRLLAAMIPGAQMRLLDSNGLDPQGDRPPSVLLAMDEFLRGLPEATTPPPSKNGLSQRETGVLRLLAAGKSNAQMADELVISVRTVERHINHIYAKLGVHNRAQAASYATRHGLA